MLCKNKRGFSCFAVVRNTKITKGMEDDLNYELGLSHDLCMSPHPSAGSLTNCWLFLHSIRIRNTWHECHQWQCRLSLNSRRDGFVGAVWEEAANWCNPRLCDCLSLASGMDQSLLTKIIAWHRMTWNRHDRGNESCDSDCHHSEMMLPRHSRTPQEGPYS